MTTEPKLAKFDEKFIDFRDIYRISVTPLAKDTDESRQEIARSFRPADHLAVPP